jgi:predicted dehydrogenase
MMKVLVVGLGSIGQRHARLLGELPELQIDVCDASTAAIERLGTAGVHEVYHSFDEALKAKPDVVFLCTPTSYHIEQVVVALEHGCHVFCEKPLTNSLTAGKDLLRLMQDSSLHVNVGFHLHFHKGLVALKKQIEEGLIGEIVQLDARVGTYITLKNSVTRYQADQKGSLFGDYTHQFDLLYWLTGKKPEKMLILAAERGGMELSSDPNVADILFRFADPFQAHIHLNYIQMPQRHNYEITGTKGWVYLDAENMYADIGTLQDNAVHRIHFTQERDDMYRAEHRLFFKSIIEGTSQESPIADALISTAMYETTMRAYLSGEWEVINY